MCDCKWGFGLDIGFIDNFYTQLISTSHYRATANLHAVQITTAPSESFPACCVFTNHSLVMAADSGHSLASALKSSLNGGSPPTLATDSFLHRLPYRTYLVPIVVVLITPQHSPRRQHTICSHMLTVSAGMCLRNRSLAAVVSSCLVRICCLATDVIRCLFRGRCLETNVYEPFSSNGSFSGSAVLALSKYTIVYNGDIVICCV
jgi:hypothetical protein